MKRICCQNVLRNNDFSRDDPNRMSHPSEVCKKCGKGWDWTHECRLASYRQGNPLSSGNALRGPSAGLSVKFGSIISSQH